jgi:hypothetical protein
MQRGKKGGWLNSISRHIPRPIGHVEAVFKL